MTDKRVSHQSDAFTRDQQKCDVGIKQKFEKGNKCRGGGLGAKLRVEGRRGYSGLDAIT